VPPPQATKCIEMKGDWGKGYGRKGAALHGLGRFDQAIAAYEKGLDVEPGLAMLTSGLNDAKREAEKEKGAGGMGGLGNVFAAPDVISKIVSNPATAPFMADPTFMMKINEIQRDPSAISKHMSDPRILQVMGMLMGVNIQTPDSMGAEMGGASSAPPPKKEPEPEPEVELTEEEKERKAKKATADEHKAKGNDAYKAKKFDEAITHYEARRRRAPRLRCCRVAARRPCALWRRTRASRVPRTARGLAPAACCRRAGSDADVCKLVWPSAGGDRGAARRDDLLQQPRRRLL
jgi:tetratricopeptide (TPR) repeat protein